MIRIGPRGRTGAGGRRVGRGGLRTHPVVRFPVFVLAERATVPRHVAAAAGFVRLATTVPAILEIDIKIV